ncbi:MAG: hypothetical protein GXY61_13825 [Lentisphaerae bacterium]|nr:hypothetical protein [Lentisphaerota bacterium]
MKTEKVYIPDGAIPNLMEEMLADIVQNGVSVDDAISELQRKTMEYFNK